MYMNFLTIPNSMPCNEFTVILAVINLVSFRSNAKITSNLLLRENK